eukprot:TRINITY_DN6548_c0_g1_i1.p1 TRINITY_DN6548_c0_g1~~TRINITY_DN6548_c0_g1_i1.p1  ORF type:complete len:417 (+),score=150.03 TRINITY_DN6548_c0_g1_i1:342-1592(+)
MASSSSSSKNSSNLDMGVISDIWRVPHPVLKDTPRIPTKQWVTQVIDFSSEYDAIRWPASSIIGAPKVYPQYGDKAGAWAQKTHGKKEHITFSYDIPVHVERMNIYETLCCGAVVKVSAKRADSYNEDDDWVEIYYREKADDNLILNLKEARIFEVVCKHSVYANVFRIDLDCTNVPTYSEIDCIELVGYEAKQHLDEKLEDLDELSGQWFDILESGKFSDCTISVYPFPFEQEEVKPEKNKDKQLFDISQLKETQDNKPESFDGFPDDFYLHSTVLHARCPKLIDYFTSDDQFVEDYKGRDDLTKSQVRAVTARKRGIFKVHGNADSWIDFLAYIYTDKLNLTRSRIFDLLRLSIEYECEDLHQKCLSKISMSQTHRDNHIDIYNFAIQIRDDGLVSKFLPVLNQFQKKNNNNNN